MIANTTYGTTPLDRDEADGLLLDISTHSELDEAEQLNIAFAELWATRRKRNDILSINFLKRLHKEMFSNVWKWAGTFRTSNKNIGIEWRAGAIAIALQELLNDVQYQIKEEVYSFDEIAARFHHRLVSIHPFPNGNGRHARLATDLLLMHYNHHRGSWGAQLELPIEEVRKQYISALREADHGNISKLLIFLRQ